ncbi:MAG: extracellular solute-binding protein [Spirochaetaceae bacterium]|nr:extracellular solute-binding protein [Spirochaetaceae bacterium]
MKRFDIILIITAIAALFTAIFFYPARKINFKRTTLVFSQWFDGGEKEALNRIIAEFEESHPGINVVSSYRTSQLVRNDCVYYMELTQNEQEGGKKKVTRRLPDIATIDPLWFNDSEKRVLFANQNMPETVSTGTKNDEFSKPLYSYFSALFYNIDILEEAGFDRPPKTRSDLMSVCLKLKEKNIYGLSVSMNFFTDIFPWIWSGLDRNEMRTLNNGNASFDFTEKSVVETLDFFNRLNKANTLGRPPFIENEEEKINNFLAGKSAMITASSQLIKLIETGYPKLRFSVSSIPYPENYPGRPVFSLNSVHAAVLSTSQNKEAAFEFLEFLSAKKAALAAAAGAVSEDAASSVFGYSRSPGEESSVSAKAQDMIESAELVEAWKIFPACSALNSIAGEEISFMLKYNRNAVETAEEIEKRYDIAAE